MQDHSTHDMYLVYVHLLYIESRVYEPLFLKLFYDSKSPLIPKTEKENTENKVKFNPPKCLHLHGYQYRDKI